MHRPVYIHIYLHARIYIHIQTYIFTLILRKYNINNVSHKNDKSNSNSNERK